MPSSKFIEVLDTPAEPHPASVSLEDILDADSRRRSSSGSSNRSSGSQKNNSSPTPSTPHIGSPGKLRKWTMGKR
jgi:hypothetical protein